MLASSPPTVTAWATPLVVFDVGHPASNATTLNRSASNRHRTDSARRLGNALARRFRSYSREVVFTGVAEEAAPAAGREILANRGATDKTPPTIPYNREVQFELIRHAAEAYLPAPGSQRLALGSCVFEVSAALRPTVPSSSFVLDPLRPGSGTYAYQVPVSTAPPTGGRCSVSCPRQGLSRFAAETEHEPAPPVQRALRGATGPRKAGCRGAPTAVLELRIRSAYSSHRRFSVARRHQIPADAAKRAAAASSAAAGNIARQHAASRSGGQRPGPADPSVTMPDDPRNAARR